MEAVIFIGLQASGKSTFYQDRFRDTHLRINLDMLRTRHREEILVRACIEAKQPFVVDNTNPEPADRRRYLDAAHDGGFRTVGYFFQSRIDDLLARNAKRPHAQRIPEKAIRGTRNRLGLPSLTEGFDELFYVTINDAGGFLVEEWRNEV